MALETGTYISDLVATNPLGSDLKSQGDDHIRLIKNTIKNTFPNIAGEVDATHTALSAANRGKNKIINGDFSVWQRGTSFAAVSSGSYCADRWRYDNGSAAVHTVSRSTDVPTVAQAGRLFNYSLLVDCTTADASIAAGDFTQIHQIIEGFNFLPLAQKSFTVSFWVKATKTGIYCVSFRNSEYDRSYVAEYTINTTDTWEKKTVTVSASPSAGTWDYTTGKGLDASFTLSAGSTYQTAADTWQTGNFIATANQVNALDSTANNFRITGVQIEPGVDATEFEHRLYSETLLDCLRYLPAWNSPGSGGKSICYCYTFDSTTGYAIFPFAVQPRVPPNGILISAATDFRIQTTSNLIASAMAFVNASHASAILAVAVSGATAGQAGRLESIGAESQILFYGCEL